MAEERNERAALIQAMKEALVPLIESAVQEALRPLKLEIAMLRKEMATRTGLAEMGIHIKNAINAKSDEGPGSIIS